ncbi:MAG: DNA polymerase I [Syntrophales bacterium]|nr:DNA polymerase I [Syntrophales bacterium]
MEGKKEGNRKTLVLVDGANYVYRAFYAIRDLSNSKGFPTNAIYGFTTMLVKLLRDQSPDYMAVVFDSRGPTFRHEAFEDYKANRAAMPDSLALQFPRIKEVVRGFSIPVIEKEGVEADDIIGTMAKSLGGDDINVVIVSGDKDLLQLVSECITIVDTMKDKSYDVDAVKERFGVPPEKVVDILGLAGDSSDNIPGVPGIGEKTAVKLISQYGSLEKIMESLDDLKSGRLKSNLAEYADQARLSRELATIRTGLDIDVSLEELARREPDGEQLRSLFTEFEFSSLLQQLLGREELSDRRYSTVMDVDAFDAVKSRIRESGRFSFEFIMDKRSRAGAGEPLGLAISTGAGEAWYIPLAVKGGEGVGIEAVISGMAPLFSDPAILKIGHDLKKSILILAGKGIPLKGADFDIMLAAWILDASKRDYSLQALAARYLNRRITSPEDLTGSGAKAISPGEIPLEEATECYCQCVDALSRLLPFLEEAIREEELDKLFRSVEMPLVEILAAMEFHGVLVDRDLLAVMSKELDELLKISEEKIYTLAGERFNINSPKQLQIILFDKLGMSRGRKTKEGYSTDVEVLAQLARSYELPGEILAYRSLAKLRSTYVEALPELIDPATGRIHTSYNQTATATGRLSSSDPNLQNIPVRTTEGKRIRQAFKAPDGWELLSSDYSQIELRILAHLSGDVELIQAFASGEDIHRKTASTVFGVFPELVNEEMRRQAKVINFGVIYGMSPFGLAKELGITQKMAKIYIDEYFERFSGVSRFIEETLEKVRQDGFVTTIMKRRRSIPEINSHVVQVRQFAERMAVNTPIQGSAADLIKIAMIRIAGAIEENRLAARMIMQVHDELVFEVPREERNFLAELVKMKMEGVIDMKVPLVVNIKAGKNWDEAH